MQKLVNDLFYVFFPCKASKSGMYISLWESLISGAQCPCGNNGYHKAPETSGRGPCAAWLWLPCVCGSPGLSGELLGALGICLQKLVKLPQWYKTGLAGH